MTPETTTKMSVQRRKKVAALAEFEGLCAKSDGLFVASYTGLNVAQLTALRQSAREAGGNIKVLKNTVAKRVLAADPKFAPLAQRLNGQLLYGTGSSAPALVRALCDFAKEQEALEVRGGAFSGLILSPEQCKHLANLPSREKLLAQLAGTLNAPLGKLARTLQDMLVSLARSLAAVRDAKGLDSS